MIDQETIERVREASDIVGVVGLYLRLKKKGRNHWAVCPFHKEKTPSFKVSTDSQLFYCFGCGKGGNVITFLMDHEKMTFVESVRFLAQKANIPIRETQSDARREKLEFLNYAHTIAVDYFHDLLMADQYKRVRQDYLKARRGITDHTIREYKIGLSGESWDGLLEFAASKDLKPEEMEEAGLALRSEKRGTYFDRFRQRLMFPIFNLSGKPIAFGGRTLKKGEPAKYINSPETPLYHKSDILYNLNLARDHIRRTGRVIVVEGYFDVISLWQAGICDVVASSGTAFTPQQARLLARFAQHVFLFFDADSAGETAALRSVDSLFDAGLDVKVMVAPEGEDPDSIAQKLGTEGIEALAETALDYIPYRVRHTDVAAMGIIEKERLVKELAALAGRLADPTRRALFIQDAAAALGVDQSLLKAVTTKPGSVAPTSPPGASFDPIEIDFLSLLLENPGSIDAMLEAVSPDDFDSKQLSRLYAAMITQYQRDSRLHAGRLVESFEEDEMRSLVSRVAAAERESEQIEPEARQRIKDMQGRARQRIRTKLQAEMKQAEAEGDQEKANRLLKEWKTYKL